MIPYGALRRLRRGVKVSAFVTLRCNFNCVYCSLKGYNGIMPTCEEISWDEWFKVFQKIEKTIPIQEVNITGGEPTLRVGVGEFINRLLDTKKYMVSLYTNLNNDRIFGVIPNSKFRIIATYHHDDDPVKYVKRYRKCRKIYRVILEEIDYQVIYGSRIKPYEKQGKGIGGQSDRFAIAPDGNAFLDMNRFFKHLRYE